MFGKKKKVSFVAPMTGTAVAITEVPDPTFAEKMMGDGIAIQPTVGEVVSPVDGTISTFFYTKHAIGITTKEGVELLIHIGLDTVNLKGEGFEGFIAEGQKVKKGERLVTFDIAKIEAAGYKTITPMIILSPDEYKSIDVLKLGAVTKGSDDVIEVTLS